MTMNTENIIRDIQNLIYYAKSYANCALDDRREAARTLSNAENGDFPSDAYYVVSEGLVDAKEALDRAKDRFVVVGDLLEDLIEDIERQTLSHKVQSK